VWQEFLVGLQFISTQLRGGCFFRRRMKIDSIVTIA
jgi:hypothetical protein